MLVKIVIDVQDEDMKDLVKILKLAKKLEVKDEKKKIKALFG